MLAAAFLRLGLMLAAFLLTGTSVMTQGDTQSYITPGANLILHGAFTSRGLPEIDRTPGYPIFAALTGMVFGNVLLAVVAQIVIATVSLWLVWRITNQVFPGGRAGLIAAWLYAVEPLSILYTLRLMPEPLFTLLLLAMIERLLSFHRTGRLSLIVAAGLLLAAATYVRPISYYLVIPLAAVLPFLSPKPRQHWWKSPALLFAIVAPLLALWQVRNFTETGYRGFSSIVEKNLYFFQSAEITAEIEHHSLAEEQKQLGYPDEASYVAAHPEQTEWTQAQRLHYMRGEALRILGEHRAQYLRSHLTGVGVVALSPCATEWLQIFGTYPGEQSMPKRIVNEGIVASAIRIATQHSGVFAFMLVLETALLITYVLAIVGVINSSATRTEMFLLIGIVFYLLLLSGGAQAVGRYRLPAMPELCIFAAGGIVALRKSKAGQTEEVMSLRHVPLTLIKRS